MARGPTPSLAALGLLVTIPSLMWPGTLRAAAETAGPLYCVNRTKVEVKVIGKSYVDANGNRRSLDGPNWTFEPGEGAYLVIGEHWLVARQFTYILETSEGRSEWVVTATGLDADGDFVLALTEDDMIIHTVNTP